MSDVIIGISVLQPIWITGIYRLWFDGQKSDGTKSQGWIFIRDAKTQGLPDKVPDYPDGCNTIWKFTRNGSRLDCTPSVNWISWGFHNAGNWSTEYVEMKFAERAESKAGPEPTRVERGSSIHFDLNRIVGLNIQEMIAELRQEGTLV